MNRAISTSSFHIRICDFFHWLTCGPFLTALAKTTKTMLDRNGKMQHSSMLPDLKGKISVFHHECNVCYDFSICDELCPLNLVCWVFFILKMRWIFFSCFFCINCGDHVFFFPFILLIWSIILMYFPRLKDSYTSFLKIFFLLKYSSGVPVMAQ